MAKNKGHNPWYISWFNTPYYHLLYRHRNEAEAAFFLDNLFSFLKLQPGSMIWDMACGKGRHAIYIAQKGFHSAGTDISPNSIEEAKKAAADFFREGTGPQFYVHDMRNPIRINYFDCVLNIFTSMGYFESVRDDERVFQSAFQSCRPGGYFVVDFLNAVEIIDNLVPKEEKMAGGILFRIERKVESGIIRKQIRFKADGREWEFEERVRAWRKEDMERMASQAGFRLMHAFGNYNLENFHEISSDRLILLFQKPDTI